MNRRPMLAFSAIAIALMLAVSAVAWLQLPPGAEIPVHWGIDGQPDGYAPAAIGLVMMPSAVALLSLLFAIIPSIEPRRANFERSRKPYAALWVGLVGLLGGLHLIVTAVALGAEIPVGRIVWGGVGILFVLIGNYLPKIRSNFLMGIRTPWTLTSERSWTRTHRVGGWLFVIVGLVLAGLGLIDAPGEVAFVALIAGTVAILVGLFAYSYVVWRGDPDRTTLGSLRG
jgi:uncharacterized membrane protein